MKKLMLAGCIIMDEQKRILLVHRNTPKRIQWETPGGKAEYGEGAADAAKREVLEELGVPVTIVKKLGEQSFREDGYEMDYIWYYARIQSGIPRIVEPHKYDTLGYHSLEDLKNRDDLSPNAKNFVDAYYTGRLDW